MATTVEGLDKWKARLAAIAGGHAKISEALWTGAGEFVDQAKRFVPVEEGDLRDSIERHWTGQGDQKGAQSADSASRQATKGAVQLSVTITAGGTPKAAHAGWVENGTSASESHVATPAQPFFWPAWRLIRKRVRSRVARALSAAVKQGAGK